MVGWATYSTSTGYCETMWIWLHKITCSVFYPSQTNLMPIHRPKRNARLGWHGRKIEKKSLESDCSPYSQEEEFLSYSKQRLTNTGTYSLSLPSVKPVVILYPRKGTEPWHFTARKEAFLERWKVFVIGSSKNTNFRLLVLTKIPGVTETQKFRFSPKINNIEYINWYTISVSKIKRVASASSSKRAFRHCSHSSASWYRFLTQHSSDEIQTQYQICATSGI